MIIQSSISVTEQALQKALDDVISPLGLKNPLVNISPTGVSLKVTYGRVRGKLKFGVGAEEGMLKLNLRDVRIEGLSIGGDWLEGVLAKLMPEELGDFTWIRKHKEFWLLHPNLVFTVAVTEEDKLWLVVGVKA